MPDELPGLVGFPEIARVEQVDARCEQILECPAFPLEGSRPRALVRPVRSLVRQWPSGEEPCWCWAQVSTCTPFQNAT